MAVEEIQTTNYNIPKYISTDSPNLLDQYNAAMDVIDSELLSVNTAASNAATAAANAGTLANTANNTANAAKATADAAATQTYVDDLDTTLSNEIATVNANLIAQQVNGTYTTTQSNTMPQQASGDVQVSVADNKSYFFITGRLTYTKNNTYSLLPIPGISNSYGVQLSGNYDLPKPQSNQSYNGVIMGYYFINVSGSIIGSLIGLSNLILATDGKLYIPLNSNESWTPPEEFRLYALQTKLTTIQMNIEPINDLNLD